MSRRIVVLVISVFVGSVVIGWAEARRGGIDVASAACVVFPACGGDGTSTSALEVDHYYADGNAVVEPDDSETWEIQAVWRADDNPFQVPFACWCSVVSSSVTAEVTWTGSVWSVSCTGCNPTSGPIRSVSICDGDSCNQGGRDHAWSYKLIVDVDHTRGPYTCGAGPQFTRFLDRVEYNTTSIDAGDTIDTGNCDEDLAVNPTTQSVGAIDYGAFECAFNCSAAGASVSIYYE